MKIAEKYFASKFGFSIEKFIFKVEKKLGQHPWVWQFVKNKLEMPHACRALPENQIGGVVWEGRVK